MIIIGVWHLPRPPAPVEQQLPPQEANKTIVTSSKIDCFVFECVYKGPYNNKFTIEVH